MASKKATAKNIVKESVKEPTKELTHQELFRLKLDRIKERIHYNLEISWEVVNKFREELSKHPTYAFEWGQDAIKASATIKLYGEFKSLIESEEFVNAEKLNNFETCVYMLETYSNNVNRTLLTKARYPKGSSSQISNLMEQYIVAELAIFMEDMTWPIKELEQIQEKIKERIQEETKQDNTGVV